MMKQADQVKFKYQTIRVILKKECSEDIKVLQSTWKPRVAALIADEIMPRKILSVHHSHLLKKVFPARRVCW